MPFHGSVGETYRVQHRVAYKLLRAHRARLLAGQVTMVSVVCSTSKKPVKKKNNIKFLFLVKAQSGVCTSTRSGVATTAAACCAAR